MIMMRRSGLLLLLVTLVGASGNRVAGPVAMLDDGAQDEALGEIHAIGEAALPGTGLPVSVEKTMPGYEKKEEGPDDLKAKAALIEKSKADLEKARALKKEAQDKIKKADAMEADQISGAHCFFCTA